MLAIWRSNSRCASVAACGTSSTNSRSTGAPSMASKSIGASRCIKALMGEVQPFRRQWGIAMPLPKPVEPSFSRAIRASKTSCISRSGTSGDQVGNLFEGFLFTAARHVHEGTAGGQDTFKSDHGLGVLTTGCALKEALGLFLMLFKLAIQLVGQ